jgi:hypothetical protein
MAQLRRSTYLLPTGLTAYLWLKGGYSGLPGFSCPLRALTGIPCPSCFLTRATCASLRGDLAGAIQLHAFGPPLAAGLVIWSVLAMRQRRLLPLPPPWPGVPGRGRRAPPAAAEASGAGIVPGRPLKLSRKPALPAAATAAAPGAALAPSASSGGADALGAYYDDN